MSEYKRFTKKDKYGHWYTDTKINDRFMWSINGKIWERDLTHCAFDGEAIDRLAELEDKIENGQLVEIPDITHKFAIVKYLFKKNKPLKVLEYYPCSYNLLSKKIANCYENCDNLNFCVIEKDFLTKEAAEAKLKELQEKNND